jgi:hypothetical protein
MMAAPTFQAIMASRIGKKEYVDVEIIHMRIRQPERPGFFKWKKDSGKVAKSYF